MNYTLLPPLQTSSQGYIKNSQVSFKNFYGNGTFAGNTGFNLGGPSGINMQGTLGIWAGSQNFNNAPFSVDLYGQVTLQSTNSAMKLSAANNNIIFYSNGVPTIVIQG